MTDHIARVREQAEREAAKVYPPIDYYDPPTAKSRRLRQKAYVKGQVDLASRLAREKIARTLAGGDWALMDRHSRAICLADADAVLGLLTDTP